VKRDKKYQVLAIAILIALFAVGALWYFIGRRIPEQNARLFENPISNIQCIRIEPVQFRSLVGREIAITNESRIKEIMSALRSAKPYSPSHPEPRWDCNLAISDSRGSSHIEIISILAASPQGNIIFCKTSEWGFFYDTLNSDSIGDFLERAIAEENGPAGQP
jgi:hypothetical protein